MVYPAVLLKPCMAAGVDGMSYSDITAMLVTSAAPQPHPLGTAQETPAPLPTPDSPLANHSDAAHAQTSFSHKDLRPSSMSAGSRHGANTDVSLVPASATLSSSTAVSLALASATHSSSISSSGSNSQAYTSLQEADTDVSLQEADTDASLQEADTFASLQEADIDAEMTCMPGQQQPAAMAETIDLQSITGAPDQHMACQIPPDVRSGSRHSSEANAHDVLHILAGAQSSDDLSMQQLQTLAGMDAESSDGTITLCDSPPQSVSSLGADDRLPSFRQAAAVQRPGVGQLDGNTILGLSDLSAEATVSRLHAEQTESLPEQQHTGSAEGTATLGMDKMIMQKSSDEVSYQGCYLFVRVVVKVEQPKHMPSQSAS